MQMIQLICEQCKNEFEKPDYFVRGELKKKPDHKFFCSKKCVYDNRTVLKKVKVVCTFCKKECITDENDIKRNKNFYCSRKCYDQYRHIPLEQRREMVDLICPQCQKPFSIIKRVYDKRKQEGCKNTYCTLKCASQASRNDYSKSFTVKCDNCGKDVVRTGRQLKLTKFHFCTPNCKGSYFARIYGLGNHRSQLELKLEEHIKNHYPTLPMLINDRIVLRGLELDLYFPTLGFGIEINGPAHFLPIYGDESLFTTQKHDIIKKNMCKKKHIRLLEITDILNYTNDNSQEIFEKYVKPLLDEILLLTTP